MYTHMYINIQRCKHTSYIQMRATYAISSDHGAASLWDTPSSCLTVWLCLAVVQVLALFPNPINTLIAFAVVMTSAAVVVFFSAAGLQQNLHAIHVVVAVTIPLAMVMDIMVGVVVDMVVAKNPAAGLEQATMVAVETRTMGGDSMIKNQSIAMLVATGLDHTIEVGLEHTIQVVVAVRCLVSSSRTCPHNQQDQSKAPISIWLQRIACAAPIFFAYGGHLPQACFGSVPGFPPSFEHLWAASESP